MTLMHAWKAGVDARSGRYDVKQACWRDVDARMEGHDVDARSGRYDVKQACCHDVDARMEGMALMHAVEGMTLSKHAVMTLMHAWKVSR